VLVGYAGLKLRGIPAASIIIRPTCALRTIAKLFSQTSDKTRPGPCTVQSRPCPARPDLARGGPRATLHVQGSSMNATRFTHIDNCNDCVKKDM